MYQQAHILVYVEWFWQYSTANGGCWAFGRLCSRINFIIRRHQQQAGHFFYASKVALTWLNWDASMSLMHWHCKLVTDHMEIRYIQNFLYGLNPVILRTDTLNISMARFEGEANTVLVVVEKRIAFTMNENDMKLEESMDIDKNCLGHPRFTAHPTMNRWYTVFIVPCWMRR